MPTRTALFILFSALALGEPATSDEGRLPFTPGEKLVYTARVWKISPSIGLDVGQATFTVSEETFQGKPCARFNARARGHGYGYSMDTRLTSHIDKETLAPIEYALEQTGSEERQKKILFFPGRAEYHKWSHCMAPRCLDPNHMIHTKGRQIHCSGCERTRHWVWRVRREHLLQGPAYDPLSALYIARQMDLEVGSEPQKITVVVDKKVWPVQVRAVREADIRTEAGTFRSLLLELKPDPGAQTDDEDRFEGLFGLSGDIGLWVDKATRYPVLVTGTLHFGVAINAEVRLLQAPKPK